MCLGIPVCKTQALNYMGFSCSIRKAGLLIPSTSFLFPAKREKENKKKRNPTQNQNPWNCMHERPTPSQVLGARCTWREFLPNAGVNTSVETVKIPKSCWESLIKNAIHRGRGRSPLHAALGRPERRGCRGRPPSPLHKKCLPVAPRSRQGLARQRPAALSLCSAPSLAPPLGSLSFLFSSNAH